MDTDSDVILGPAGRELRELAKGSLTTGYQTAVIQIMGAVERAMEERQLTQKDLADRMGVDASYVSRQLNNPDNLTMRTLYRFCNAVGVALKVEVHETHWAREENREPEATSSEV